MRKECEARVARDVAFRGSKGVGKDGAVGTSGTMKLGIATARAVFGTSERSGVCDWRWERPEGARPKGEMAAQEP